MPSAPFLKDELSELAAVLRKEPVQEDDITKVLGQFFSIHQGPSMAAALTTAGSDLQIERLHAFQPRDVTLACTAKRLRADTGSVDPSSIKAAASIPTAAARKPYRGCWITVNDNVLDAYASARSNCCVIKHLIIWSPSMRSALFLKEKLTGYAVRLGSRVVLDEVPIKVLGQLFSITDGWSIAAAHKTAGWQSQIDRSHCLELMDAARATHMSRIGADGFDSPSIAADESIPAASISTPDYRYLIPVNVSVLDVHAFAASAFCVIKHLIIPVHALDPRTDQNLDALGSALGKPFLLHDKPVIKCLINLSLDNQAPTYVRSHDYRHPSTNRCLLPPPRRLNQVARTVAPNTPSLNPALQGSVVFGVHFRGTQL